MLKNSPGLQSYRGFGVPSFGAIPSGTFYRGSSPSQYSARMLKEKGDPLAQFSGINPESILGNQKSTKEKALKFISGDAPLGSSIASLASNKIVGFNRAKVSPRPTNIQNLISTLTSNVFNDNSSITNKIVGFDRAKVSSRPANIQNLIKTLISKVFNNNSITSDNSSITNIFGTNNTQGTKERGGLFSFVGGAFDKIKEALAFVSFFGSKKNLDRIKKSIETLKIVFTETFEIAKALRKAIIKIFKELSGIDGSGGGGFGNILSTIGGLLGGLIPGMKGKPAAEALEGGAKVARTARVAEEGGNIFSKIGRFAKGGGKAALIGGGALAAGTAISGLSGPGDSSVQPGETPMDIPGTVLDKFNSILDRFDKILDGLKGTKTPDKKGGAAKSSGGGSGGSPGGGGGGGGGGAPPGGSEQTQQILKNDPEFTTAINELAKAKGYDASDLLAMIGSETGGTFDPKIKNPNGGATGLFQITRESGIAERLGYKSFDEFSKAAQKMTRAEQVRKLGTEYFKNAPNNLKGGQLYAQLFLPGRFNPKSGDNQVLTRSGEGYYTGNKGLDVNRDGKITVSDLNTQIGNMKKQYGIKPGQSSTAQAPTALALPAPSQVAEKLQTVAQKPGQAQPSVSVISTGGQQQAAPSGGGGGTVSLPAPAKNGPDVPFPSPKNPDNFLVFYSRLTYNIIDG